MKKEEKNPDYLTLNPQGLVPTLICDDLVITQSLAICDWAETTFKNPSLLGSTNQSMRAKILSKVLIIACDTHPLNNLRVLHYLEENFEQKQEGKAKWMSHWISQSFETLEKTVDSTYLVGNAITLADVFLVPQWYNAQRFGINLTPFPKLSEIIERCMQIPEVDAAKPVDPEA